MNCFHHIERRVYKFAVGFVVLVSLTAVNGARAETSRSEKSDRPNIVIIYTDDQGYGDVGCFGAEGFTTPHLDRMASEGMKLTSFMVAQAVCSASRAALLTGCYPNRIGIRGALGPKANHGIAKSETTIAEVLKPRGYATGAFGKWHLGHHTPFLPTRHGFDEYYGLPYSNDMWPQHPTNKSFPPLPLIDQEEIIEYDPDQTQLTMDYTERAVTFIEKNKDEPFFVYLAHSMPHVPLFVSDKFAGKTEQGMYGDVIAEIDWSVGRILETLDKLGLDENTFVIFTSDNGPWLSYGNHGGSAGPLREGKGTSWEGGMREPTIVRWPGTIPAGTESNELLATIDLLPTIAEFTGGDLPKLHIDGKSIADVLTGKAGATSPHEAYFYYWLDELHAVRSGEWKLHFPHSYRSLKDKPGKDGTPGPYYQAKTGLALYNLDDDIGETINVAEQHPEIVERLTALADEMREDLGDRLTRTEGKGQRPPDKLPETK